MSRRLDAEPAVCPAPLPLRSRRASDLTPASQDARPRLVTQPAREAAAQLLLAIGAFLAGALAALTLGTWLFTLVLAAIVAATFAAWCGWRWVADHRRSVQDAGERLQAVQRELDRIQPAAGGRA